MPLPAKLERQAYRSGLKRDTPCGQWADAWLRVLLQQDGSATLLCETIAQAPVDLVVIHQQIAEHVPPQVRAHLGGERFIERQVVMFHDNKVMMDNLTFVALDQLDPEIAQHLTETEAPIGYIFAKKSNIKRPVSVPDGVLDRLWQRAGTPDPEAARSYILEIEGKKSMLITEVYRAGMRQGLPT